MEGRSEVAIDAARKVASKLSAEKLREMPMLNSFAVVPLFAYTRFGKWEEILQEPRPADDLLFLAGIWHYARGLAFTATGRLGAAATELESLDKIAADKSLQELALFSPNPGAPIIKIAAEVLAGRLAAKRGETEKAIARLHRAVLLEDALVYTEPADWHYPVRQSLGAVLLQAGRAAEAETVYWEDLRRNPENGWSLFGLMKSLEAQGKTEQAEEIEQRFRKAWDRANVTLTASRF
jgi:tetratricopeptide (TPR) repeat protein